MSATQEKTPSADTYDAINRKHLKNKVKLLCILHIQTLNCMGGADRFLLVSLN